MNSEIPKSVLDQIKTVKELDSNEIQNKILKLNKNCIIDIQIVNFHYIWKLYIIFYIIKGNFTDNVQKLPFIKINLTV